MKILLVHNYYQKAGGEDVVVDSELDLLLSYGHKAKLFSVSNDDIKGLKQIKVASQTTYSYPARYRLSKEIFRFEPDVVHVHNFFPLLSPSIYDACMDNKVPVIQTLHNFRLICPGALLMRKGNICEKCVTASAYQSVLYRCYRNSVFGTCAVARMVENHRRKQTWHNKVDRFIVLTDFARKKFVEGGFPENKIVVKPNFCKKPENKKTASEGKRNHQCESALFVGRLSHEKGLNALLNAWQELDIPLRIAGDGPLKNMIKDYCYRHISFLGMLTPDRVSEEMDNASFLIMPSEWYEGFPMVLVEAFSHGLPVVASRLGSMEEIVEDGTTGLLFEAGNVEDLADKAIWMVEHPDECRRMGKNARCIYEEKYAPENNYKMLMKIYQDVLSEK